MTPVSCAGDAPRLFQDLALLAQDADLAPQPARLFPLVTGQPVAALTVIQIGLLEPESQRLARHAQLPRGSCACGFPLVRASRIASARNSGG
jgi:hypothetical protein